MRSTAHVLVVLVVAGTGALGVACLGGQPSRTREASEALGDRSGGVPRATLAERDWKEAARGHGAAGPISASELARLEKESAPGGALPDDAGTDAAK